MRLACKGDSLPPLRRTARRPSAHEPLPTPKNPSQYPEVLGSILGGLKAVVNVIGMTRMTPPIKELLPRLTPVLKNRHEKARRRERPRESGRGGEGARAPRALF